MQLKYLDNVQYNGLPWGGEKRLHVDGCVSYRNWKNIVTQKPNKFSLLYPNKTSKGGPTGNNVPSSSQVK